MKKLITLLLFCAGTLSFAASPKTYSVSSPDNQLSVVVSVGETISYSLKRLGNELLAPSEISMTLSDGVVLGKGDKVRSSKISRHSREIPAILYKKAVVKDIYNEMRLSFKEFDLLFRAYDDGIAYRFCSKAKGEYKVVSEKAEFRFNGDPEAYASYVISIKEPLVEQFVSSQENLYSHFRLSEWDMRRLAFAPLLVEAASGEKLCITESDLIDYPGLNFYGAEGGVDGVFAPKPTKEELGGHNMLQGIILERAPYLAECSGPRAFPWRTIVVATEDKELIGNDMVWKLSSPSVGDFSWVKPGKVAWDWWNDWNLYGVDFKAGINNDTYKYYIDFAAAKGIEYVILDEGWAVNLKTDLMQVIPEIDLPMLCRYAGERGVGLILWAGYKAFDRDMEAVCKHYSEMGVKGFKIDFMDRDDQIVVDFYRRSAEVCAKYKLMADFHGAFKPSGLNRTWPNVVNFEGVYGMEQLKWGQDDVVGYDISIAFIRMLAGPMDYTQGAMRNASKLNWRPVGNEAMSQGTRCRQLAQYVIYEAPLSMLCDSPSNYLNEPECTDYIADIPTVWDETVALEGKIGEYVAVARRSGDTWYVGAMTDWTPRDMELDLSSLVGKKEIVLDVYRDGINADKAARDYKHEQVKSSPDGKVTIHMASGGGWVGIIR